MSYATIPYLSLSNASNNKVNADAVISVSGSALTDVPITQTSTLQNTFGDVGFVASSEVDFLNATVKNLTIATGNSNSVDADVITGTLTQDVNNTNTTTTNLTVTGSTTFTNLTLAGVQWGDSSVKSILWRKYYTDVAASNTASNIFYCSATSGLNDASKEWVAKVEVRGVSTTQASMSRFTVFKSSNSGAWNTIMEYGYSTDPAKIGIPVIGTQPTGGSLTTDPYFYVDQTASTTTNDGSVSYSVTVDFSVVKGTAVSLTIS